jgi:phospholipid/cholesterol/gamma-HCH transport system substrate-binding protein
MKISANKNVVTNFNKVSGDFAQISDSIKSGLRKKQRVEHNYRKSKRKEFRFWQGTMGKLLNDDALYSI